MRASWDPEAGVTVKRSVLACEIVALSVALNIVAAALRQSARACRELGRDGGIGSDPVGEGILAVLNDGLGSLVSVIGWTSLTWGDRGVVNELQKVLSVACNDGELLAVLAEGIELVSISCL